MVPQLRYWNLSGIFAKPGTCCQTQNPQFTNPIQNDYNLLSGSPCIQNGVDGYYIGACFFTEIPESPKLFEFIQHESDSSQIHMRWIIPDRTTLGNMLDSVASVKIWRNDSLIAEILNNHLYYQFRYALVQ